MGFAICTKHALKQVFCFVHHKPITGMIMSVIHTMKVRVMN